MLRTAVSSRALFKCLPSLSACLLPKGGCPLASLSVLRSHSCDLTLCAPPPSCLSLHSYPQHVCMPPFPPLGSFVLFAFPSHVCAFSCSCIPLCRAIPACLRAMMIVCKSCQRRWGKGLQRCKLLTSWAAAPLPQQRCHGQVELGCTSTLAGGGWGSSCLLHVLLHSISTIKTCWNGLQRVMFCCALLGAAAGGGGAEQGVCAAALGRRQFAPSWCDQLGRVANRPEGASMQQCPDITLRVATEGPLALPTPSIRFAN